MGTEENTDEFYRAENRRLLVKVNNADGKEKSEMQEKMIQNYDKIKEKNEEDHFGAHIFLVLFSYEVTDENPNQADALVSRVADVLALLVTLNPAHNCLLFNVWLTKARLCLFTPALKCEDEGIALLTTFCQNWEINNYDVPDKDGYARIKDFAKEIQIILQKPKKAILHEKEKLRGIDDFFTENSAAWMTQATLDLYDRVVSVEISALVP